MMFILLSCGSPSERGEGHLLTSEHKVWEHSDFSLTYEEGRSILHFPSFDVDVEVPSGGFGRIALSSTTQLSFFHALNQLDKVVACTWMDGVQDDSIQHLLSSQGVIELIQGGVLDREKLISASPDVFLYSEQERAMVPGLERYGITCVPFIDDQAHTPLDRAAWLVVSGALTARHEAAIDSILQIRTRYDAVHDAGTIDDQKVLMVSVYQGRWSASGGQSLIARLIRDAGGEYILSDGDRGSVSLDKEEVLHLLSEVDQLGLISAGDVDLVQALKEVGYTFNVDSALHLFEVDVLEKDYFGKAILEPEVLLQDIRSLLAQEDSAHFHYFRPLDY